MGTGVLVGVAVGVLVGVLLGVSVGVNVGVLVGVAVGVFVDTGVPSMTSQPAKSPSPQTADESKVSKLQLTSHELAQDSKVKHCGARLGQGAPVEASRHPQQAPVAALGATHIMSDKPTTASATGRIEMVPKRPRQVPSSGRSEPRASMPQTTGRRQQTGEPRRPGWTQNRETYAGPAKHGRWSRPLITLSRKAHRSSSQGRGLASAVLCSPFTRAVYPPIKSLLTKRGQGLGERGPRKRLRRRLRSAPHAPTTQPPPSGEEIRRARSQFSVAKV
jgi:hypothetical protein